MGRVSKGKRRLRASSKRRATRRRVGIGPGHLTFLTKPARRRILARGNPDWYSAIALDAASGSFCFTRTRRRAPRDTRRRSCNGNEGEGQRSWTRGSRQRGGRCAVGAVRPHGRVCGSYQTGNGCTRSALGVDRGIVSRRNEAFARGVGGDRLALAGILALVQDVAGSGGAGC